MMSSRVAEQQSQKCPIASLYPVCLHVVMIVFKPKANLARMNEDSGSSQVMRPFPPSQQQAEIELQQSAPETSKII